MFSEEFYPTPREVIEKMIYPFTLGAYWKEKGIENDQRTWRYDEKGLRRDYVILEPSAGSGAILDYLHENNNGLKNIYCCEQDFELQHTLMGKGHKVIESDFLNLTGEMLFDLILMNPPFSNGDEHLLHAWKILDSGDIVCLLNEETIKNPFTKKRELLAGIIKQYGSVEYLGNCFSDADRKTDVNVALVRLHKPSNESRINFKCDDYEKTGQNFHVDESSFENTVALFDVLENMIVQSDRSKEAFLDVMKACDRLRFYAEPIKTEYFDPVEFALGILKEQKYKATKVGVNDFHMHFQRMMWGNVLQHLKVDKYMTSSSLKDFNKFLDMNKNMKFSKENMAKIVDMIFQTKDQVLEKSIIEAFELLTSFDAKNKVHQEGWKTNEAYKVAPKVIVPWMIQWGSSYDTADWKKKYGCKFEVVNWHKGYSDHTNMYDVDKALCYLTGKDYNMILSVGDALMHRFDCIGKIRTGEKFDDSIIYSEFFEIKFYKKGTVHLKFRDKKVLEQLNFRAALNKNWLPEEEVKAYTRKKKEEKAKESGSTYQEMEPEKLLLELF